LRRSQLRENANTRAARPELAAADSLAAFLRAFGNSAASASICDQGAGGAVLALEPDTASECAGPDRRKLVVQRAGAPPVDTLTRARCKPAPPSA
jgi:hypothetical protein